jgi:hypothetical protein
MTIELKLWWVIIWTIALVLLIFFIIRYSIVNTFKDSKITDEVATTYKGDKFGDMTWKWSWTQNPYTSEYEPIDPIPLCNTGRCNFRELQISQTSYSGSTFFCNGCQLSYGGTLTPMQMKAHIVQRAKTKVHK